MERAELRCLPRVSRDWVLQDIQPLPVGESESRLSSPKVGAGRVRHLCRCDSRGPPPTASETLESAGTTGGSFGNVPTMR
jgi:hypothetical protein